METTQVARPPDATREQSFLDEAISVWGKVENKGVFAALLAAWILLFHFLGNSTFGYHLGASLFDWTLADYAGNPDDEHGKLIPFVVLGLLWWKRKELLALPQKPWWPGLLLLGLACFIHVLGFLVQQARVSVFAFFFGVYAIFGVVWGSRWMRAALFPFALFVFAIPVAFWLDPLTIPLRIMAAQVTHFVCHGIFGVNLVRQGTQLLDPSGRFNFDVAAACSGIRSLVALTALTTVYAMVVFRSSWRRLLVLCSAIPLSLICNILRLVCVVMASVLFGEKAGQFVHEWFGFLTYAIALACVMGLGAALREPSEPPAGAALA
jgi:exosortase